MDDQKLQFQTADQAPHAVLWFDASDGTLKFTGDADLAARELIALMKESIDQYIQDQLAAAA